MKNINFKGNEIRIGFSTCEFKDEFKDYWKKASEKYDKTYDIVEDGEVDLTILNADFSTTRLYRYHFKNSKNKIVYVIQQSDASGDDVYFTFYFSYQKIKDEDIAELIETVDKMQTMFF